MATGRDSFMSILLQSKATRPERNRFRLPTAPATVYPRIDGLSPRARTRTARPSPHGVRPASSCRPSISTGEPAPMFVWTRKFETGIGSIDEQHQKLVGILNRVYTAIEEERVRADSLDQLLQELVDYSHYHFREEEGLMERAGVVEKHAHLHRLEHRAFIYDVERLRGKRASTADLDHLAQQVAAFATNWLTMHILGIDQSLARQIRDLENGVSATEAYRRHGEYTYDRSVTHDIVQTLLTMWRDAEDRLLEEREQD